MDHYNAVVGLIGILYLAIIGVYIWTYKVSRDVQSQLGEIYKVVSNHVQKADIHTEEKELVKADVFNVMFQNLTDTVNEIKDDVKCLLDKER